MQSEALTFGGRLRRMCEHAGVPLGEMASICGVGPSGFAGYLSNRIRMPASKYALVAQKLGISMDGLYQALGLHDTERGDAELAAWWSDMLVRHHSLEASGLVQNPLYAPDRSDLYENENDLKMNSDRPGAPFTLCSPFGALVQMGV